MLTPRAPTVAAALVLSAASAGAQTAATHFAGTTRFVEWPATLGSGSFTRTVAGQLTPDRVRDVVVLRGDTAVLLFGPAEFEAFASFPAVVTELDVLRRGGDNGTDAIALVGPAGLSLGRHDAASNTLSATVVDVTVAGAPFARTGDLDGDGLDDVALVAPDRMSVRTYMQRPTGGFVSGPTLASGSAIEVIAPFQWDADPHLELALSTASDVEVRELDGTLDWNFGQPYLDVKFAPVKLATDSRQRLAGVGGPASTQFLWWLDPDGSPPVPQGFGLGGTDVRAISAAAWEADGDEDLFVSVAYDHVVAELHNRAATSSTLFTNNDGKLWHLTHGSMPAPLDRADPLAADLDADGDPDLLFAIQSSQRVFIEENARISAEAITPSVVGGEARPPSVAGNPFVLQFNVQPPLAPVAGATHLVVDVWHQTSLASDIDPAAIARIEVALPAPWTQPTSVEVSLPLSGLVFTDVFTVQARAVRRTAGTITHAAPALIFGYTTDRPTLDQMDGECHDGRPRRPVRVPWSEDPWQGGGFSPRPAVRHFPLNQLPATGL